MWSECVRGRTVSCILQVTEGLSFRPDNPDSPSIGIVGGTQGVRASFDRIEALSNRDEGDA